MDTKFTIQIKGDKKDQLQKPDKSTYLLFGWEAVEARPNLDPFTGTLRTIDETGQVYTTDVHLKHHVRRGMKAEVRTNLRERFSNNDEQLDNTIFYEKYDDQGNSRAFATRLDALREAYQIPAKEKSESDALIRCIDLPLFGYVHAVTDESFNVVNAANTLFRPVTFHSCKILQLGRNNAFPGEAESGEAKASAGSSSVDSLEYGFFLALWEVNHHLLETNCKNHKILPWNEFGIQGWLSLLCSGMWRAYTTDRYPSFTQRSQFAKFLIGWTPEWSDVKPFYPAHLIQNLGDETLIDSPSVARAKLAEILPDFLNKWGWRAENECLRKVSPEFSLEKQPTTSKQVANA